MKKKYIAALVAAIFVTVFYIGCSETLIAPKEFSGSHNTGNGGGGAEPVVPGSGGRTVGTWLDRSFNASPGEYGMRITHMNQDGSINPEEITTQSTLGLWEDGKFHIEGFGTGHNGGFQNAGFVNTTLLYFDKPFEEEFKISARVRMMRAGGVGTSKGLHFGAYINHNNGNPDSITDETGTYPRFGAGQNSKGLGMFLRAEPNPNFRLYYSDEFASTTAGNTAFGNAGALLTNLSINKEYIYEIARTRINPSLPYSIENAHYTYKLFDSKTGRVVFDSTRALISAPNTWADRSLTLNSDMHPFGSAVKMHDSLKHTVYAGILMSGSAAEVSQIKIWENGNAVWDYRADFIDEDGKLKARQLDVNGNPVLDAEGDFIIIASTADKPFFWTPETIPAYVPANRILLETADIIPARAPDLEGIVSVFAWNTTAAYNNQFVIPGNFRIDLTPRLDPDFAENTIFFELIPIGNLPSVFTIEGLGDRQEVEEFATDRELYKRWRINFDPDLLTSGVSVRANFVLIARDLTLDVPGGIIDTPEYSLLQTLPENFFAIELTKP